MTQLNEADLASADLSVAQLPWAHLAGADLTDAELYNVDLSGADLSGAHLRGAHFLNTKLDHAQLRWADLRGGGLQQQDLTGAYLEQAYLTGAHLEQANLTGARLSGAELSDAIYEPSGQPLVQSIAYARGLDRLRYRTNPEPLSLLRKAFQDAGFVQQRRQVTAALHRSRLESEGELTYQLYKKDCTDKKSSFCIVRLLPISATWLAFDWTCEWGANWSHPLVLLGWLCLLCGPMYWVGMHFGRLGGIYQIELSEVVATRTAKEVVTRVDVGARYIALRRLRGRRVKLWLRLVGMALRAEVRAVRMAFWFSALSTLDIGFHEFNLGQWARMLPPREFNLKARGWMRVVAGVQSLVGLGFVALSLLSYFGHPFD